MMQSGKTTRNEYICEVVGVALTEYKLIVIRLKWFDHVQYNANEECYNHHKWKC